ncbi:MAG: shikimate dehydrogenase family protein [Gemmatimonadota bacterium]
MSPSRDERCFALLGHPVGHSLSPAIHAAAFRALKVSACYVAVDVSGREMPAAMRRYAHLGGGNVTLPHKRLAAELLELRAARVEATGASNCFWLDAAGRLAGDNTDVEGFRAASSALLGSGAALREARLLLLGAGGAARAVLAACLEAGAARVEILNRTPRTARRLAEEVGRGSPAVKVLERDAVPSGPYDLVVNATRLGLREEDALPIEPEACEAGAVLDLVYAPGGTPWVRAAEAAGIPAVDGVEMLVQQAAGSLRCWFPEMEPPLAEMRAAARRALAGRPREIGGVDPACGTGPGQDAGADAGRASGKRG